MNTDSHCDNLMAFILGELREEARSQFLDHLSNCLDCQSELEQIWPVHERLLTGDVAGFHDQGDDWMDSILHAYRTHGPQSDTSDPLSQKWYVSRSRWWRKVHLQQRSRRATWSAAAMIAVALSLWTMHGAFGRNTQPVSARAITLRPVNSDSSSVGHVVIQPESGSDHVMVAVSNLPPLNGWGCYDLWVTGPHQHFKSLAEFVVNKQGSNTIAVEVPKETSFQTIELTAEPAWGDHHPLGLVILTTDAT